uniref:non-specific serine/threonine protein kinase n=1 Tax=Phallusia mammillata TaxID=59560 RepID=A0A6F9DCQ8_9ASCI|nr:serine/threonine-protein kinase/endoribonuclease IRE1-like [Phallusia mammillata]
MASIPLVLCVLLIFSRAACEERSAPTPVRANTPAKDVSPSEPLLLVSTLDGVLHAIDKKTGTVKWKLNEDPVFNVPMESTTSIKGPTFLPDPHDGSLYAYDPSSSSRGLTKLPFTIPELVQASPCRSSDGILYTGKKQDVWYAINPANGIKEQVITTESAVDKCPGGGSSHMYIGRSEFKVTMFDTKSNLMRWNVTYADYSSHANEETANNYDLHHLASSADGSIVTIDKQTGRILWAQNYGYPVVAMYAWVPEGLQKVEMTNVAKETMTYVLQQADGKTAYWEALFKTSFPRKEATLVPSLYVGQYRDSLYALPALTHDGVQFNLQRKVHMLPGPTGEDSSSTDLDVSNVVVPFWHLIGYHKIPPYSKISFPRNYEQNHKKQLQIEHQQKLDLAPMDPAPLPKIDLPETEVKINGEPPFFDGRENIKTPTKPVTPTETPKEKTMFDFKWSEIIVATLTSLVTASVFFLVSKSGSSQRKYNGLVQVGRISLDPTDILGRGSEGTIVYRGSFDGRKVAVKRVVPECFSFADREVSLLRESDEHAHVVRYFCMERDTQFQYIALELCSNTLQEFVENPQFRCSTGLDTKTVLNQAMLGLDHLHLLKIVHRDVKPSNILISVPGNLSKQRVVISDFGLCKKLIPGRQSFSHRSGQAGTDGWIAPEMILDKKYRMTQAVDIFSMGCVFYYVICGKHPFGDPLTRQARIVNGEYSMEEIQGFENSEEAIDVIRLMLLVDPSLRPKSSTILKHPLFWDSVKTLQFFEDVSDRIEKEPLDSITMLHLDRDSLGDITNGIPRDWMQHLCAPLQDDLQRFRTYRAGSVRDLLRAMRNKKHHYRELPEQVKLSLGSVPDQFLSYFTSRFPRILIHTYLSMACCRNEPTFRDYYGENAQDHLFEENLGEQSIFRHSNNNHARTVWKKNGSPRAPRKVLTAADKDSDWRSGSSRIDNVRHVPAYTTPPNSKYVSKGSFSSLNRLHQSLHGRHPRDEVEVKEMNTLKPRSNSWQTVPRKTMRRISESSSSCSDPDVNRSSRGSSFNGSYADALSRTMMPDITKNKFDVISVDDDEDDCDQDENKLHLKIDDVDVVVDNVDTDDASSVKSLGEKDAVETISAADCMEDLEVALKDNTTLNNDDVPNVEKKTTEVTISSVNDVAEIGNDNNGDAKHASDDAKEPAVEKPKAKSKRRRRFKKNKNKTTGGEEEHCESKCDAEVT